MSVYRRPDSKFWQLCLERPGQKPVREPTKIPVDGGTPEDTKRNRELAKQVYSTRMADLARKRHGIYEERQEITFGAYRRWYYTHISVTKRGVSRERSLLNQLGSYFDAWKLSAIERSHVMEWRTTRAEHVAPATVNRELGLLIHVLGSAIPKYLESNPATGVRALRVPDRAIRLLEPDEETRLLAVCDAEERAMVLCALDTLQRLSNVCNLRRADDHGRYLTVWNSKTDTYEVPVSQRLRKALDALRKKKGPFYFPSAQKSNEDVRRVLMTRRFSALLTRAGITAGRKQDGMTFHCLRHTGASRMLARGVDIKTVQTIGNWKDIKVLLRYLHPSDAQKFAAVEVIGREPDVNSERGKARSHEARTKRQARKADAKTRAKPRLARAS